MILKRRLCVQRPGAKCLTTGMDILLSVGLTTCSSTKVAINIDCTHLHCCTIVIAYVPDTGIHMYEFMYTRCICDRIVCILASGTS